MGTPRMQGDADPALLPVCVAVLLLSSLSWSRRNILPNASTFPPSLSWTMSKMLLAIDRIPIPAPGRGSPDELVSEDGSFIPPQKGECDPLSRHSLSVQLEGKRKMIKGNHPAASTTHAPFLVSGISNTRATFFFSSSSLVRFA